MEDGYVEPFNGKFRDKLLACEVFNTLAEARILIERWRVHYNTLRPPSSLGYRSPALDALFSGLPVSPGKPGPEGSVQPAVAVMH